MSSPIIVTTPDELRTIIRETIQQMPSRSVQETDSPLKKLLTGEEVEKEYGITARNLEYWRSQGIGPQYVTIGRRIFYERQVLDAYIKDCRIATARAAG